MSLRYVDTSTLVRCYFPDEPEVVLPLARTLVSTHPLHSLDALHLAVARSTAAALTGDEPVVLLTRDQRQAAAAVALAMPVE